MKTGKLTAVLIIVAIIGLLVACDNENDPQLQTYKTYTVTFDADNGTENTTQTVTEGEKATEPENPSKDGFIFDYWFDETTDTEWDFNTVITADITLKAKWTLDEEIVSSPNGKSKENASPLTFNNWAEWNQGPWFSFIATASPQYIHIDCGTVAYPAFYVYDNNGNKIGDTSYPYGGGFESRRVVIGQTYYINTSQVYDRSYKITFNDSEIPPAITLPASGITQLTHNTWTEDELTWIGGQPASSKREQWYRFTATTDSEYIHCSHLQGCVRLYDHNGVAVGNGVQADGGISFSQDVITGQLYYIKVWSHYEVTYPYKIAFNSANIQPPIALPTETTQLSLNTWTNGEIVDEDQWFKFTATSNECYVHLNEGTIDVGYVQLYDKDGVTVDEVAYLGFPGSFSRAVTVDDVYYMRVYPVTSSRIGTYQIALTESNRPPAIALPTEGITQLTESTWFYDVISSSGERRWYKFTASADMQYIHFVYDSPLPTTGIKVYDDSGVRVYGVGIGVYNVLSSIPVTNGADYYFEVWHSSQVGTYKVAFNTATIPPP